MFTRRRFVQGVGGGALLLAHGRGRVLGAAAAPASSPARDFDLTIDELPVNFTGAARRAVAVNGQVPGADCCACARATTVTIRVTNNLRERTSIHWHGFILPADMDGVPGLSFDGIAPGTTFTYRFKVNQSGTYWYHSHSRFQEQVGLYGPIVVERRGGERHAADREHVLLLSDWTDHDPEHIYATLKRQSDYYNFGKRTVGGFPRRRARAGLRGHGRRPAHVGRDAHESHRSRRRQRLRLHLSIERRHAGRATGPALFTPGERVRLRLINGSSMSFFDLRIPGLKLTVVATDGQDVEPVTVDELRIGTAEVYDVIVDAGRCGLHRCSRSPWTARVSRAARWRRAPA